MRYDAQVRPLLNVSALGVMKRQPFSLRDPVQLIVNAVHRLLEVQALHFEFELEVDTLVVTTFSLPRQQLYEVAM